MGEPGLGRDIPSLHPSRYLVVEGSDTDNRQVSQVTWLYCHVFELISVYAGSDVLYLNLSGTDHIVLTSKKGTIIDHQRNPPRPLATTVPMSYTIREGANRASTSKRPRESPETDQSPPSKRSKTDQDPTTEPIESTAMYDACPMPSVTDYFYEDLIPEALELSQLFPTLCHDIYVVRRWLGSVGCAIYWRMVIEDINKTPNAPNPSSPLAGLIARSLAKIRGPPKDASSSKFHTFCETLRAHLGPGNARRVMVFGEFR